jgi:cytochrome c556
MRSCHISIGILMLVLLLFAGSGMSDERQDGVNRHRQVQSDASPYQIHDEQLRETMLQLNALVSYSEQPAVPLDNDSKEFLQKLIDTVGVVASSAESLKQTDKIDHLNDEQWSKYTKLTDQLYSEAIEIDINARQMNVEEMNEAFLNLNQTCISCHKLFRNL